MQVLYTVFLVVKTFPNLEQGIGEHATFWLYAGTVPGKPTNSLKVLNTEAYQPE
jgi:hypothetical protein